jgi:hypothetical protein
MDVGDKWGYLPLRSGENFDALAFQKPRFLDSVC